MTMRRSPKIHSLFALLALALSSARCAGPQNVGDSSNSAGGEAAVKPPAGSTEQGNDAVASPIRFDGPSYLIKYKFPDDAKLYYVIENHFTDHGGVPPILTYTTHAEDKRTIIQSRAPAAAATPIASPGAPETVTLQWECDRYEAREHGLKDEVTFDSLRDSYARAEIRELGAIPGSTVIFDFNPRTGDASNRRIVPNRNTGPITRRRLSRTTMRCALNDENLRRLMDDLGPLFLPKGPVHVGETWTNVRSEDVKSFGRAFTDFRFTLTGVEKGEDRTLATIAIAGEARLEPETETHTNGAPRGRPNARNQKPREYQIDHQACTGSIVFDIDNGQLVSLDLRRELDLSASLEGELENMRLETGDAHHLKVEVFNEAPRRPLIAGGTRPPANDPPEPAGPGQRTPPATRKRIPPAKPSANIRPELTTPNDMSGVIGQPRSVSERLRPTSPPPNPPTTQPANAPIVQKRPSPASQPAD